MALAQGHVEALDAAIAELGPRRIGTRNCLDDDERLQVCDIDVATVL